MKLLTKAVAGAAIGVGVLAASAVTAFMSDMNIRHRLVSLFMRMTGNGVRVKNLRSANTKAEDIGAEIPGPPGKLKRPPTRRPLFLS